MLDDAVYAHPGAAGSMMIPPSAVKAGLLRCLVRGDSATCTPLDEAACSTSPAIAAHVSEPSAHALCVFRSDACGLRTETWDSKDAESVSGGGVKQLQETDQLENEILRMRRNSDKEMTETQGAKRAHTQEALGEDIARKSYEAEEEPQKDDQKSLDSVISQTEIDTAQLQLTAVTKTHVDVQSVGALVVAKKGTRVTGSGPTPSPNDLPWPDATTIDRMSREMIPIQYDGGANELVASRSISFWRGFMETLRTQATAGSGLLWSDDGRSSKEDGSAPPALLLLSTIPLFYLYRLWCIKRR